MKPSRYLGTLGLVACALYPLSAQAQAPRPNIIFILVDDLGYGDLGTFWQDQGSTAAKKFDTPNIDRMAAEGVKLTHHYVGAPVCAPSRASLITGRHQGHAEVRDSQFDKALPNNHTLASVLKRAGYSTALIGKAGLSGEENSVNLAGTGSKALAAHPMKQGFDRFWGYHFHDDGHEHYPQNGTTEKTAFIYDDYRQVTEASVDLYTTDVWTAAAKKMILDEARDGDDQPFFIYLSYDTPHFKMQRPAVAYPPLDADGDPTTGGIQWTTANDAAGHVRYASTATGKGVLDAYTHPDIPAGWANAEKQHVGMIRRIDDAVGDIIQTLKDLGIADNTLIVFTSDNGPHNEGNNPRTFQSFANLEGTKRDMWEGGIRVPAVVRWPAGIANATKDESNARESDFPSASWDWMPTFAALAGISAPARTDGVSLVPTLTGSGVQRDNGYLYFGFANDGATPNWADFANHRGAARGQMQVVRVGAHVGVRTQIATGLEPFLIYELAKDPAEGNDLAATLPALQAQMQALALTSRRPVGGVERPYDSLNLPAAPAPSSLMPGLRYKVYAGAFPWVPEYRDLMPTTISSAGNFAAGEHAPPDDSGILYLGYIDVPRAGSYTFSLTTDGGGSLRVHDSNVIDDDFNHDGQAVSGDVRLAAGLHPYRLYYRHGTGQHALTLEWSGPGIDQQPIPDQNLRFDPDADDEPVGGVGGAGGNVGQAGSGALGGSPAAGGTTAPISGGASPNSGGAPSSAGSNGTFPAGGTKTDSGCGCSVPSGKRRLPLSALAGAALIWLGMSRRRRCRRRSSN